MKRNYFTYMLQAVVLLCTSLVVSSCDDILATEDNPIPAYLTVNTNDMTLNVGQSITRKAISVSDAVVTYSSSAETVATVDSEGKVTGVAPGTAVITIKATGYSTGGKKIFIEEEKTYTVTVVDNIYLVRAWDGTQVTETPTAIPTNANVVGNSDADVTWDAETYVVDGNVTINGKVSITRDVKLIIKDGAKLTVNGSMLGYDGVSIYYGLSIYGQKENSGKLIVNATNAGEYCLHAKSLEVHGCEINAESKELFGIYTYNTILDHNITMYSGKLTAKAGTSSTGNGQIGIGTFGDINVYGGELIGIGGDGNGNTEYKVGIYAHGNITVNGGNVEATGGNASGTGDGGSGIYSDGDITINGIASITATANGNNGIGIYANNNIQIGQTGTPIVNATGYQYGIQAVTQIDFIAGNVKGTSTGVMEIGIYSGQINYYGGTVEGECGDGGVGISTITNKSGATVTIGRRQYPTNGWTAEDVANNAASTKYNCYMILPMP